MKSLKELETIRDNTLERVDVRNKADADKRVLVGMATCGIAAGARPVMEAFADVVKSQNLSGVSVEQTGCLGVCPLEPMVEVFVPGQEKVTYINLSPEKVDRIVSEHIVGGNVVTEYTIGYEDGMDTADTKTAIDDMDYYKKQERVALRNCGVIDPESIDEYIARDGYRALGQCLTEKKPQDVIDIVKDSGLRGRGGGGFPTGMKWQFAAKEDSEQKYFICNADEGDPGAFMDRSVLEGDPHAVLEAMAIAGYAIGADTGYIYVRAEYPIAVKRLQIAVDQAKEYNLLGNDIFGTGFNFDIIIRLGAGAFVCGEETSLMESLEGRRGEPRPKPPFPAVKGLFGKPTIINNVESLANIPQIILRGADWFAGMGTEKSKGTKVFALGGKINNTGLVEIPMGTTLKEVIYDIGGGIPGGKEFKAVQTGGPSGGCLPASMLDLNIDYDNLVANGSMMGSGGMIVMDEDNCMVDVARFFLDFTVDESCGKCPPCRIGTKRMLEMLENIVAGKGKEGDVDKLEALAAQIKEGALCALGKTAPNPVLSTIKHFRDEYDAHINEKRCPAGNCKELLSFEILPDKCIGCGLCKSVCPVDAISGEKKQPHVIDKDVCIKCGACIDACKFDAIVKK